VGETLQGMVRCGRSVGDPMTPTSLRTDLWRHERV